MINLMWNNFDFSLNCSYSFDLETNEDNGFMHPNPAYEDLATINSREPKKPAENIYQAYDDKPIINY